MLKKLLSPDAPRKIALRLKTWRIARSVVRANPLFRLFSYQWRVRKHVLDARHTVLVVGINGGIGEAIARQLLAQGCRVVGTYRSEPPSLLDNDRLLLFRMDISRIEDGQAVYDDLQRRGCFLDAVVVATGYNSRLDYHASVGGAGVGIESLAREADEILQSFSSNTLGPYLVLRRFATLLTPDRSPFRFVPQLCLLSSSLGTMHSELYGGMYGYRTAKGAMHALAMALFCDLNVERPVGVLILGPGNVDTKMNPGGKISPETSAAEMIRNIEYSAGSAKFQFLGVKGKRIPW